MKKEMIGIIIVSSILGGPCVKGGSMMSREKEAPPRVYRDKNRRLDPTSEQGIKYGLMESKFAHIREKVLRDKVVPLIQLGEIEVRGEFRPRKTLSLPKFDIKVILFSGGFDLFYKNHFDDIPLSEEDEAQSHRTQEQAQEIVNDVFKYFSSKVEARTKEPVPQVVCTLSLEIITPQEEADKGLAYYFLQRKYPTHFEKWILVSSGQKLREPGRIIAYGWQVPQGKPADDGAQR